LSWRNASLKLHILQAFAHVRISDGAASPLKFGGLLI
jgi:hypothetical protein